MKFRAVTIIIFFLAVRFAPAENSWFARPWRTDDGLPDNSISGIVQTPDGFLWAGTIGGLARFDGARFEEFSPANFSETYSHAIRAMTLDHLGRLWLGIDRGAVVCVAQDRMKIFDRKDGLPDWMPRIITEDADGTIWICYVGTHNAIAQIKDGKVTLLDISSLPWHGSQCWITTDSKGQLWFARGGEIGIYRDGNFQVLKTLEETSASIAKARDGGIWICTPNRLLKIYEDAQLQEFGKLPQPGIGAGALYESRDGAVWLGTSRALGLFRFDGKNFELVPTSHPIINCLAEDREGNLWVGTAGGGVDRLRPKVIDLINPGTQPLESIHSICEDAAGDLWAVSRDGALICGRENHWRTVSESPNWPGGRAGCVTSDSRGNVWIGTRSMGLYRFRTNQFTAYKTGLTGTSIRSLLIAANGDIWIGSDPGRLQRMHNGKIKFFTLPPDARFVRAMAEDSHKNIWVATSEGLLLRVDGTNVINETTNCLREPISIRCLATTSDGALWIGYADGGLGRLKDGKYFRITTALGLDDNYISGIVPDGQGWLWISGSRGFSRIRLEQLNDVCDGRSSHLRSVAFGAGEGMSGLQTAYENFPTAFRGSDGRLYIATHTGVAIVDTRNIRDNLSPPPVLIERATVDGQTVARYDSRSPLQPENAREVLDLKDTATKIHLPSGYHRLEFDFAALSFTAPENVRFRYQLEGLDEDWIEAGTEHRAVYPRLSKGNYRFRVIACNNSIVWSPTGATLSFTVQPFFWQTWWFESALFMAFTIIVIALVRYLSFRRLRFKLQLLEQQAALDKERARIARDLHDDLGGSLTEVSLLLDMAQRNHNGNGNGAEMQKCATMVRGVAHSVDEIIWAINPRNDTAPYLVDYISQSVVEFLHAANIQCRVHLPAKVPDKNISPEARHNLFLVVKESLNNIARHAQATEVHFCVAADDEKISIVVEDNGHGFERAPNGATDDGLRNMKHRMEEIGGQFHIESKPETGTCVSFVYPWPEK